MKNAKNLNSTDLILALIKANLCHNKLLLGLEKAGLQGEDFYGDLDTVILQLMGFDLGNRENELYDFCYDTTLALLEIDIKDFRPNLQHLAQEFYDALQKKQ